MVVCMERGADLHMAQLMPMPLIVSCFSKIQIGFTFLVPVYLGSPGKKAIKRVCVCVCVRACVCVIFDNKMEWRTTSNAFEKSINKRRIYELFSNIRVE